MDNEEDVKSLEEDLKQSAINIKNYCKDRDKCDGCIFDNGIMCKLIGKSSLSFLPEDWRV